MDKLFLSVQNVVLSSLTEHIIAPFAKGRIEFGYAKCRQLNVIQY